MFPITNNDPEGLALVKKIEIALNKDRQDTIKFLNDIPMYFYYLYWVKHIIMK